MEQTPKAFAVSVSLALLVAFGCFLYSLSRTILPSCVHMFPHLRIPVGLQCAFLLLPQLTEVHSLHFQRSRPAHHLLCLLVFQGDSDSADAAGVAFNWTFGQWRAEGFKEIDGGVLIKASSLFSNVVGTLGLPVVPVLPVIFFHDKMFRIKHYLDDHMSKTAENENARLKH
ncbi:unnamed protein product [Prunus armeniaca]|uniref:Uncharacterized protein n=1 Tax=Prunus armeniaca TaxID=36596 RepID=A0A6J5UNP2_PRUAR|nr:unnamed protein product [Prunus armeniaca]